MPILHVNMRIVFKKLLVIIPVIIVSLVYFRSFYPEVYGNASSKRTFGFLLSIALLYGWIIFFTVRRKQDSFIQIIVQSSFFVYVFAVLQLTGYFILFKEISSGDWWDKMNHRIDVKDHVNFTPFQTIHIYDRFDKQVLGNFVMLLPLGIYLPLLYSRLRKASGFFAVLFFAFLVSVSIELLQLATSYRSTDVDDVILNTLGACLGFVIFLTIKMLLFPRKSMTI